MMWSTLTLWAHTSITVKAPEAVVVGEQFRVSFVVTTQDVDDFQAPDFKGFEVLYGPSSSRQSSYQIINGKASSQSSITYTYTLYAPKEGTFEVTPAMVMVGGKKYHSNSCTISVLPAEQRSQSQNNNSQAQQRTSGNELFIKVSTSKTKVYEQEAVLLTYKVYSQVDLRQLMGVPALNGVFTQEISLPQEKSMKLENYQGKNYRTVVWKQYVLFPQKAGNLVIPSVTFQGLVYVRNQSIDPFDAFFGGGSFMTEVKRAIVAPACTIRVESLPNKPENFSGAVGNFKISSTLSAQEIKANDALTMRLVVSGSGNMKLFDAPEIKFPTDFETYDAKVTEKLSVRANGNSGEKIFEYIAVPRHVGKYEIPPVEFCYFDPSSATYKTIKTEGFNLQIAKGKDGGTRQNDYTSKEELKLLGADIRYIKTGEINSRGENSLYQSNVYIWIYIGLFLLFMSGVFVFRKQAVDNANIVGQRRKRASKVVNKRMKQARKLLQSNQKEAFYDELMRTLWGYVGDKLNIAVANLNKDNVQFELTSRGVDSQIVDDFLKVLNDCEFARFAPSGLGITPDDMLQTAGEVIDKIEGSIKKNTKTMMNHLNNYTKIVLCVLVFLPMSISLYAYEKVDADSAYSKENYDEALNIYSALNEEEENSTLYYNIGNCHYRKGEIAKAILNYERALLLNPSDKDVRFNLELARSKTIDKIVPERDLFFVSWYHIILNGFSVDGWAIMGLTCFVLMLVGVLMYLFASQLLYKKIGFFSAVLLFLFTVVSNIFAHEQYSKLTQRTGAIIMPTSVVVKSTPNSAGTELFVLHEGTYVEIVDESMKEWCEIKLSDGKVGWIQVSEIERI